MNLRVLHETPPADLARSLAEFESQFTYPLGSQGSFRISHGQDYPRFFRSMGVARCFVAERPGGVRGTLSIAVRTVVTPDGQSLRAAYIGDLKFDPSRGSSLAFVRMAQAADQWARPQVTAGFGVVMDGTRVAPTRYTGRAGIQAFFELGRIGVLRFRTDREGAERFRIAADDEGEQCRRALSRGRYFSFGGDPGERSEMAPCWLVHREGLACGRLEDTRRAKRLIDHDGIEMLSAHLACFSWRTLGAAMELIHAARRHAAELGFPALFVSVPRCDIEAIESGVGPIDKLIAPATVYGAGLPRDALWNINSSEI